MEEQKNSKEIKMNTVKSGNQSEEGSKQKLTYEQLVEACNQLYEQNKKLVAQLRQVEYTNVLKRLEYLFKVAEIANSNGNWKFTDDFVQRCFSEIEEMMTVPEEEKNETEGN